MDNGEVIEGRVSSEPCKPTTSVCERLAHCVRRREGDVRSAVVPVRFTKGEREVLKGFADTHCLSLSEYVRALAFGRKLPRPAMPEINRQTYLEITRVGNNLNQLVRGANNGLVTGVDRDFLMEICRNVWNAASVMLDVE